MAIDKDPEFPRGPIFQICRDDPITVPHWFLLAGVNAIVSEAEHSGEILPGSDILQAAATWACREDEKEQKSQKLKSVFATKEELEAEVRRIVWEIRLIDMDRDAGLAEKVYNLTVKFVNDLQAGTVGHLDWVEISDDELRSLAEFISQGLRKSETHPAPAPTPFESSDPAAPEGSSAPGV